VQEKDLSRPAERAAKMEACSTLGGTADRRFLGKGALEKKGRFFARKRVTKEIIARPAPLEAPSSPSFLVEERDRSHYSQKRGRDNRVVVFLEGGGKKKGKRKGRKKRSRVTQCLRFPVSLLCGKRNSKMLPASLARGKRGRVFPPPRGGKEKTGDCREIQSEEKAVILETISRRGKYPLLVHQKKGNYEKATVSASS